MTTFGRTDQNRVNSLLQAVFSATATGGSLTPGAGGGSGFAISPPYHLRLMTVACSNTSNGTVGRIFSISAPRIRLPIVSDGPGTIGGAGLGLKQDTFVSSGAEIQLSDVHFTILQKIFGYKEATFGVGKNIVPDILA